MNERYVRVQTLFISLYFMKYQCYFGVCGYFDKEAVPMAGCTCMYPGVHGVCTPEVHGIHIPDVPRGTWDMYPGYMWHVLGVHGHIPLGYILQTYPGVHGVRFLGT